MFIFFICILVAVVIYFNRRLNDVESKQFELMAGNRPPASSREELNELTVRVLSLEKEVAALRRAPRKTSEVPVQVSQPPKPQSEVIIPQATPPAIILPPRVTEPVAIQPVPSFGERVRSWLGEEEWETLVGGSLLNKLGALVFVIGIALFLGYSFTHMSPAGRALTSLGVSFALLGGGIWFERKPKFKIFSRGLIAAGWAALYVTSYAMYALPAAKLIENAALGSLLLLLVSVAMVAHSLRYRSQAVTGVAFFTTFAALAVTPSTTAAVLALLPLSISVLYLAYRYSWSAMAVFGAVATYLTCAMRGQSGKPLVEAESLFLVYWLVFEAFDLMRTRRRQTDSGLRFLFPLNAVGFLGLSQAVWASKAPESIWMLYAGSAGLYLVSAGCRWFLRPRNSFAETDGLVERIFAGSFEAPGLLAACLSGLAIAVHATGVFQGFGFAVEAEILYVAGIYLSAPVFSYFGWAGFAISLASLAVNTVLRSGQFAPLALFHAFMFYVNRLLRQPNVIFSSLAAALVASVLADELRSGWIGTSWLAFAFLLFELGFRTRLTEFRYQAYVLAAGGCASTMAMHVFFGWNTPVLALWCALIAVYALVLRIRFGGVNPLSVEETRWLDIAGSGAIAALASYVTFRLASTDYEGLCIAALALVLFELGLRKLPSALAYWSYAVAAGGALLVVAAPALPFQKFAAHSVSISYGGLALCAYWLSWRASRAIQRGVCSTVGCLFALAAIWIVVPDAFVPPVWAFFAVGLYMVGHKRSMAEARWQAYFVASASVLTAISASILDLPERIFGIHTGVLGAAGVIGLCYLAQLLSPVVGQGLPEGELGRVDRHPRIFWSIAATSLLTFVLSHEFPGGFLTTALGVEALTLLGFGFLLRERILRLQGLSLLLLCILKLFFWDLRNLETLYRILSFIALGAIMLGVSWIYTRFKENLKQLL